jgi:acyl-CoA thioester hydrolase
MAVSFDLDTRKIIALSDAELARVNAEAIEGLSL